jgi:hypothetical protein
MFEKPKFFKTEKPNRSLEKNRMPSPTYAACGDIEAACWVFDGMPTKNASVFKDMAPSADPRSSFWKMLPVSQFKARLKETSVWC